MMPARIHVLQLSLIPEQPSLESGLAPFLTCTWPVAEGLSPTLPAGSPSIIQGKEKPVLTDLGREAETQGLYLDQFTKQIFLLKTEQEVPGAVQAVACLTSEGTDFGASQSARVKGTARSG